MDKNTPMELVDRDLINEILAEQELSSQLGAESSRLALGQVLGARIAIQCRFGKLGNTEQLLLKIDDTETTKRIPAPSVKLSESSSPDKIVEEAASGIGDAVAKAYPLKGRLYRNSGVVTINIGQNVGVKEGSLFEVLRDPEGDPIPGAVVSVKQDVGATTARVAADGLESSQLPDAAANGWYVRERPKAS